MRKGRSGRERACPERADDDACYLEFVVDAAEPGAGPGAFAVCDDGLAFIGLRRDLHRNQVPAWAGRAARGPLPNLWGYGSSGCSALCGRVMDTPQQPCRFTPHARASRAS